MKKICFIMAMLICILSLSLPCYAADEPENIFALEKENLAEVNISMASGNLPSDMGGYVKANGSVLKLNDKYNANLTLKSAMTNGITSEAIADRFFIEKPSNYTTYELNTKSDKDNPGTAIPGVSIVFKFNMTSDNKANKNPGINRLVIFAGDDSFTSDSPTGTLKPEYITVSGSDNSAAYTKADFKATDCKFYYRNVSGSKKGEQILTLDFDTPITSKFIKICIKSANGAFRIREVEAYKTDNSSSNIISSSTVNNQSTDKAFSLGLTDEASDKDYTYIAARNDKNGSFLSAAVQKANPEGNVVFDKDVTGVDINPWGGEAVKIFIWDGFTNLKPISSVYTAIPHNARPAE